METNKIQDTKNHECIKEKLTKEINTISKKIQEKTDMQSLLLQYKQYDNNSHIPVGIISLFTISFISIRMLNIDVPNAIMLGLIGSSSLSLGTKIYFKRKQDKMKKSNPNIDFINYNIDENYEAIEELFSQKFELVDELKKQNENIIKKDDDKRHQDEIIQLLNEENINYNIETIEEKNKVKTLKRM